MAEQDNVDILQIIAKGLSEYEGCAAWIEHIGSHDAGIGFHYTQLGERLHILCEQQCVLELRGAELILFSTYVPGKIAGDSKIFSVDINDPDSITKIAKFLGIDESKKKTNKMSVMDIIARIVELE